MDYPRADSERSMDDSVSKNSANALKTSDMWVPSKVLPVLPLF